MSRKSVSKRSSAAAMSAIVDSPSSDGQRLDLEKICVINPWQDMKKYDEQEAGQIQQVLTQFNEMILGDNKKNKRKSSVRSRASKSPAEATVGRKVVPDNEKSVSKDNASTEDIQNSGESAFARENEENEENLNNLRNRAEDIRKLQTKSKTNLDQTEKIADKKKEKSAKSLNRVLEKSLEKKCYSKSSKAKTSVGENIVGVDENVEKGRINTENFHYWLSMADDGESNVTAVEEADHVENVDGEEDVLVDEDNSSFRGMSIQTLISPLAPSVTRSVINDAVEFSNNSFGNDVHDSSANRSVVDECSKEQSFERVVDDSENKGLERSYSEHGTGNRSTSSSIEVLMDPSDVESIPLPADNRIDVKSTTIRDDKFFKAMNKFSREFVKYSNKMRYRQDYKDGPIYLESDLSSVDSESDSSSSSRDESSSSRDESSSSSDESSSSSDESSSDSSTDTCSCSSCYTASSSASANSSCSCSGCRSDNCDYSEYTLASSSSSGSASDSSDESSED